MYRKSFCSSAINANTSSPEEQRESADAISLAGVNGEYAPIIGRRFALEDAAAAHQLQEDNTIHGSGTLTGKIVVQIRN